MRALRTALLLVLAAMALSAAPFAGARAQRLDRGAPPAGERGLLPHEVVIEVANSLSAAQIDALQRRHRLTRLAALRLHLSGTTLLRSRIRDRRPVAAVVRALAREAAVLSVQPNYLFTQQ